MAERMADNTPSEFGHLGASSARRKVSFDPTINLGHVLTFLGFIVAGFSAYSTLDKRVTVVEQAAAAQESRVKETLGDIKTEVRETRRTLDEFARSQRPPVVYGQQSQSR
jgi:hypothetical protein